MSPTRPSVLLTLPDTPFPSDRGMRMRGAALLRGLAAIADVDLVVVLPEEAIPVPDLPSGLGAARATIVRLPRSFGAGAAARMVSCGLPWRLAVRETSLARRALAAWTQSAYDAVWFGSVDHAVLLGRYLSAPRSLVDMADVESAKSATFLSKSADPGLGAAIERTKVRLERPLWARIERRAAHRHDILTVCSRREAEHLAGSSAVVVPNTYPDPGVAGTDLSAREPVLLLAGSWSYQPNVDAARTAARDVLPIVRAFHPDARLRLVGDGREHLRGLEELAGVDVVGRVPSMVPELARASVVLVSVNYGGGTRLKVLEAMAHGVPVVSTPLGVEGIEVRDGEDVLLAAGPASLAAACNRLLADRALGTRIARSARMRYERQYQPEASDSAVALALSRALDPRDDSSSAPR